MVTWALELEDLWLEAVGPAGARPLVRGVGLRIAPGEALALVGLSGAGKTLTASALCGLLPSGVRVSRGRLRLAGRVVDLRRPDGWRRLRGGGVLYLFQGAGAALDPAMRLRTQLAEALQAVRRLSAAAADQAAGEALARFGLEPDRQRAFPHQLSGGMRRRALLALAWALLPRVLIADEPATGLDPQNQESMTEAFRRLAAEHDTALLLITHDLRSAVSLCSRMAVMHEGRIVEQGRVASLLSQPTHGLTRRMVESLAFLEGRRV